MFEPLLWALVGIVVMFILAVLAVVISYNVVQHARTSLGEAEGVLAVTQRDAEVCRTALDTLQKDHAQTLQQLQARDNSLREQYAQIQNRDERLARASIDLERCHRQLHEADKRRRAVETEAQQVRHGDDQLQQLERERALIANQGESIAALQQENERLRLVVQGFRDLKIPASDGPLPPLPKFMSQCAEFWMSCNRDDCRCGAPLLLDRLTVEQVLDLLGSETLTPTDLAWLRERGFVFVIHEGGRGLRLTSASPACLSEDGTADETIRARWTEVLSGAMGANKTYQVMEG